MWTVTGSGLSWLFSEEPRKDDCDIAGAAPDGGTAQPLGSSGVGGAAPSELTVSPQNYACSVAHATDPSTAVVCQAVL